MPRKNLPPRKAQAALLAIKLEKARYEIRTLRRAERAREAAIALRKATPDWVEMNHRLRHIELEKEMDAMEARIEAYWPKAPILNFDLMPGFEPPAKSGLAEPTPTEHPDVAEARRIDKARAAHDALMASNENRSSPLSSHLSGKNCKYDSIADGYDPAHDWRNYE